MDRIILRLTVILAAARRRWYQLLAQPERGEVSDYTVVTALVVILAVTVLGIITAKVTGAANGISLP